MPLFHFHPSSGMVVSHAVLMTFFVICPAILGGVAQWYLPRALGAERMSLPSCSILGLALLTVGDLILPFVPSAGLAIWALGMLSVSYNIIATVLEGREIRFRDMPPLAWSLLATACALVVINPVLLALLVKGQSVLPLVQTLRLPEMSLILIPSLGLVAQIFLSVSGHKQGIVHRLSPYLFGAMGAIGPLLWVDTLFGGLPHEALSVAVIMGQVVPGLILLVSLCIEGWSYSIRQRAASLWIFGAVFLLLVGWLSLLAPHIVGQMVFHVEGRMVAGAEFGHQAAIFGSLMALSGTFYIWFSHYMDVRGVWFERLGMFHAAVTFLGIMCSIIPTWSVYAPVALLVSVLAFVLMGVVAWRRFVLHCVGGDALIPTDGR
ncbi:hypothetical protein GS501_03570 [Saccharibacter sp. 17.LH.SD]|nr:hypothetical protein [Saccharibacter sp. 17.LH.SD]MXV44133.1 hypothetical protein [Saccharibacter sp. 17.LH.SD]